jgi:zinc D-Ala-D-Ala carboxypeptidase
VNYFQPHELECPCCGMNKFDPRMLHILNLAREQFGRPIILNSACRCEAHNTAVGGAHKSAHLIGPDGFCHAVDIRCVSDITRATLHEIFTHLGIRRFEVSDAHIHVDNTYWLPTPLLRAVTFAVVKGD